MVLWSIPQIRHSPGPLGNSLNDVFINVYLDDITNNLTEFS